MATQSKGMSGAAIAVSAAGLWIMWSSVRNVPLLSGLRDFLQGKIPAEVPSVPKASFSTDGSPRQSFGIDPGPAATAFVNMARAQIGKPYRWATAGPNTFDCSGLVVYCLKQQGIKAPHYTGLMNVSWTGATNIPRSAIRAGDLVCYNGHVGIATSNDRMVHAPRAGKNVEERDIYNNGPGQPWGRRIKWPQPSARMEMANK